MKSLGFRLLVFYAALISVVLVLLAVVTFLSVGRYLEKRQGNTLLTRARLIADTLVARMPQTGEAAFVKEVENRFAPETYGRFIRVTDAQGRVLYESGAPHDQSFTPKLVEPAATNGTHDFVRKETLADSTLLLLATTYYSSGASGRYVVEVGSSLADTQAFLHQLLVIFLIVFPVVIIVSVGGGHFLIRRALAPVESIANTAEEITFHNLSQRLPVAHTDDELERLSLSLNRMIDRLDKSFQHAQRFSADASHELRTPLTVIRGELESLVQDKSLPPEIRESLGSLLEEAEGLQKIVDGLFALAKIEAGDTRMEWNTVDLSELAANTAEQMCLLAEDKKISVSCEAAEPVTVHGDRGRLKQVIINLLDNAIKFTPPGGKVTIHTGSRNGTALLDVSDTGPGIPADAIPRVFERFFRVDEARSRDVGGAGIGLSIVKSIITAHGGTVSVESVVSQGTCFHIQLPRHSISQEKNHGNKS